MASEEQQEELEAIQAIFMDDYQNHTKVKLQIVLSYNIYTLNPGLAALKIIYTSHSFH